MDYTISKRLCQATLSSDSATTIKRLSRATFPPKASDFSDYASDYRATIPAAGAQVGAKARASQAKPVAPALFGMFAAFCPAYVILSVIRQIAPNAVNLGCKALLRLRYDGI